MSWSIKQVRELRVGNYMNIDDEPCKIVEITTSKPGKHGEAKARIVAIGIFDNQKRSVVFPVTHKVQVPIIEKKTAQVISIEGDEAQLMDMETYETFHIPLSEEEKELVEPGKEVMYMEAMGRRKIYR
ncbi:MAG: translation initiation factor IF-5A [Thermoplasmata archaeon]|nr:translation initiation factor IF-5A [Thermoplasmata archaeon]HDD60619.1 translation initiation factor IF-5A [Euryarchaeota archaeon]RLF55794.1 MAG: translation initiation factor IF-5A [Thermoplasmata archaeon]RLF69738.1 MAG: translation initiation factor IF-5A [Thermoplasmata archaeon]RLF71092.1 MAG: translation initiation factor IF-5A [Thermoplasmata archaeon]